MKTKKSEMTWETLAKLVIALIFLLFMVIVLFKYKEKIILFLQSVKDYLRFR